MEHLGIGKLVKYVDGNSVAALYIKPSNANCNLFNLL